MLTNHIFNVKRISEKLPAGVDAEQAYEKILQAFKGAATGSPAVLRQVRDIIKKDSAEAVAHLDRLVKHMERTAKKTARI